MEGFYDLTTYASDNGINAKLSCINKPGCNYESDTIVATDGGDGDDDGLCNSCSLYPNEEECYLSDYNKRSSCGWGSIKNVCETMYNIDDCHNMYIDGCRWDIATQRCTLSNLSDDDGNPLVGKVGCIKCGDIKTYQACNSIDNCFWNIGDNICEACSSRNRSHCGDTDDASRGRCQFRDNELYSEGFDTSQLLGDIFEDEQELLKLSFKNSWFESLLNSIGFNIGCSAHNDDRDACIQDSRKCVYMGDEDDGLCMNCEDIIDSGNCNTNGNCYWDEDLDTCLTNKDEELCSDTDKCQCLPVKQYPLFPDWTLHNLVFLIVFVPFMLYFIYAWYYVLLSPNMFDSVTIKQSGGDLAELESYTRGQVNKLKNTKYITKITALTSKVPLFQGITSGRLFTKNAMFHDVFPMTDSSTKWIYILLKAGWLVLTFPLTIIQIIKENVRLSIPQRIYNAVAPKIPGVINIATIPTPIGFVLQFIAFLAKWALFFFILVEGFSQLLQISEFGINPNPAYSNEAGNAALYPQRIYRKEWDKLVSEPLPREVLDERIKVLPEFLQGDYIDLSKVANFEIEPESLNWSKYPRYIGKLYNKLINIFGDKFIGYYVFTPLLLYAYYKFTSKYILDYQISNDRTTFITQLAVCTFGIALLFGIGHSLLDKGPTDIDEYDGAETKCFDIPILNKLCFGDANDEEKDECPYGCYHKDTGKKCKNNRSIFSLGGIFDPDPKLNLPLSEPTQGDAFPPEWNTQETYSCPPPPSNTSKLPYDLLCSSGVTRCMATADTVNRVFPPSDADNYCEIMYHYSDYDDDQCNNGFNVLPEEGPQGTIAGYNRNIECSIREPDFRNDTHCPFDTGTIELTDFSEIDQRVPVDGWKWLYDTVTLQNSSPQEPIIVDPENELRYLIVNQEYDNSLFT